MPHTTSLKNSIYDTLVDCESIFGDLFEEMLVTAYSKISHLFDAGVWIDEFTFRDKIAANLLLACMGNRAHWSESLETIRSCGSGPVEVTSIDPSNQQPCSKKEWTYRCSYCGPEMFETPGSEVSIYTARSRSSRSSRISKLVSLRA